jgi:hypothetical protein
MNSVRLEKSLHILRSLNKARLDREMTVVSKYEAMLRQHDFDARDKCDARQTTIFESIS